MGTLLTSGGNSGGGNNGFLTSLDSLPAIASVKPKIWYSSALYRKINDTNYDTVMTNSSKEVVRAPVTTINTWTTICDEVGGGLLAGIVSPILNATGSLEMEVTLDGVVSVYTFPSITAYTGAYKGQLNPSSRGTNGSTMTDSFSYDTTNRTIIIPTCRECSAFGANIASYKTGLKVRIKPSVALRTFNNNNYCEVIREKLETS